MPPEKQTDRGNYETILKVSRSACVAWFLGRLIDIIRELYYYY